MLADWWAILRSINSYTKNVPGSEKNNIFMSPFPSPKIIFEVLLTLLAPHSRHGGKTLGVRVQNILGDGNGFIKNGIVFAAQYIGGCLRISVPHPFFFLSSTESVTRWKNPCRMCSA